MLIKLRCSPVSENMPISYGTQAITVQSLGRFAHQGSKSSTKLQETRVFSRVFEDSAAITVLGTNIDVPAHRRIGDSMSYRTRCCGILNNTCCAPNVCAASILSKAYQPLPVWDFILLTTERNMVSSGIYFTGDGEKLFVASV